MGSSIAIPAGAATGRNPVFCKNVQTLTAVPVLSLPTSTQFFALLGALTTVTNVQQTLQRDLRTIAEMQSAVPSVTAKAWYTKAGEAVVAENTVLSLVLTDATTLLTNPKNTKDTVIVANAVASAAASAAVANTYLAVAQPVSTALCAKWPVPTKPKKKPIKKH
jgi:hypothetical protein